MKQYSKKQVFIIFENNRMESHCQDGSILQFKKQSIVYVSPKGIKNNLCFQQIHRSHDLRQKFVNCLQKWNLYSCEDCYVDVEAIATGAQGTDMTAFGQQRDYVKMGVKLSQFLWFNPQVQETKSSYKISSDCSLASLQLKKDLYLVQVNYLQLVKSSNAYLTKTPNMTKLLLQKYNYQYAEFPISPLQKQKIEYVYLKVKKIFNIFSVPDSWKYPLQLIWNSLLKYKVISHQFCYIQYKQHQLRTKTFMPKLKTLQQFLQFRNEKPREGQNNNSDNLQKEQALSLPILGKINHFDKCLFLSIDNFIAWFNGSNQANLNICYDGYGFWFYQNNSFNYRKINKPQFDKQFYFKALPYTIRFENEPERSVINELKIFLSYFAQSQQKQKINDYKKNIQKKPQKFDNQNTLVYQQNLNQIGNFKAFSNGVIIVKFVDRSLLTLNSKRMQAKLIKRNGQTCLIDLSHVQSYNYIQNKELINYAKDFQERVFYPEQWQQKQLMNESIKQYLEDTQTHKKISSVYLKL